MPNECKKPVPIAFVKISFQTLSKPGVSPFFSSERTIRIRASGSTSTTGSLSSFVSVEMSFSELSGVKWYEWASTNSFIRSKCDFTKQLTPCAKVSFDTFGKEFGLIGVCSGSLVT